jgi:hypothetical protein
LQSPDTIFIDGKIKGVSVDRQTGESVVRSWASMRVPDRASGRWLPALASVDEIMNRNERCEIEVLLKELGELLAG